MGQSVECLLDARLDGLVRAEWDALADAGLRGREHPSPDQPARRPHITLTWATAYDEDDERDLPGVVLAGSALPEAAVGLGGLVVFGRRPHFVLARAVVPTKDLLDLHERVATRLRHSPGFAATALPDAWTPHVTLARLRSADELARAIDLLSPGRGAGVGSVVAVRRWDGDRRQERIIAGTPPPLPR